MNENKKITIALGSDHAGFAYKVRLAEYPRQAGYEVKDVGCPSEERCHYPLFAHRLCRLVQSGDCRFGILICGTGIGMSMAANKHRGIRAAVCSDEYSTRMTREHNDANVLCLGARVIDYETAERLVDIFINTGYIGGDHDTRVRMLGEIENCSFKDGE